MNLTRIVQIHVNLSPVNFLWALISALLIKWTVYFRDLNFRHFNPKFWLQSGHSWHLQNHGISTCRQNLTHIVSKDQEIASHTCKSALLLIFKFGHEINLFQLDQRVFIYVYLVNFPHFEILHSLSR